VKRATTSTKRNVAIALGAALVIVLVFVATSSGLSRPGVPEGDVAIVDGVDNGSVSQEQYDRALEQSAARLGLKEVPPTDDPQYVQLKDETMQGLLLAIWAEGEAADRGLEVTETDVQNELDQIRESFKTEKEFARVVEESKFCSDEEIEAGTPPAECEDVLRQARLLALQRKLSDAFTSNPTVTEDDAREFYDSNLESFETPATRDVRVILNEDEATVEKAKAELEGLTPDSPEFEKAWRDAALEYSQDQASKDRGGLLEGLVEGQGDPQLEAEAFSAPVGELVGPFETDRGFYLIQVVGETEATTQSFEEAQPVIEQQLVAARQQAEQAQLQSDFVTKWTRRTNCDESVAMQFCSGFVPPEAEPIPGQPALPEPPPVVSTAPIEPGTATFSIDGTTQTGLPQAPQTPAAEQPTGLPEDAIPVGPDGAPVVPPTGTGAAPTQTAP
jgi:foldase protein PrsA